MDVVLEVLDTFLFDRIYANVLPIHPAVSSYNPVSTLSASLKADNGINATSWSSSEAPIGDFARSGWTYTPSTEWWPIEPSEYAYMSRWDRDNIYRKCVTLYAITW